MVWDTAHGGYEETIREEHLPDESDGVGHHSVRVILILSDVVDEGQDELHTRLHQHHVR